MVEHLPGFCQCAETIIHEVDKKTGAVLRTRRIIPPLAHNCYYVKLRDALITRAEHEAYVAARQEWERDHGRRTPVPELLVSSHFSRIMDRYVARANAAARADVPQIGPERNRAFYANMRALIEGRST